MIACVLIPYHGDEKEFPFFLAFGDSERQDEPGKIGGVAGRGLVGEVLERHEGISQVYPVFGNKRFLYHVIHLSAVATEFVWKLMGRSLKLQGFCDRCVGEEIVVDPLTIAPRNVCLELALLVGNFAIDEGCHPTVAPLWSAVPRLTTVSGPRGEAVARGG